MPVPRKHFSAEEFVLYCDGYSARYSTFEGLNIPPNCGISVIFETVSYCLRDPPVREEFYLAAIIDQINETELSHRNDRGPDRIPA